MPSWADLRHELGISESFRPATLAEADAAASRTALPEHDRTDIELFSVDPAGSRDLDQAMSFERTGNGYRVFYAIADVAAFVAAGSSLDTESRARGETFYAPDVRVPMLPAVLSEGAASLLAGELRPAALWTIDVDGSGRTTAIDVRRARVRSRQALDYETVQQGIDGSTADPIVSMLRPVGELLLGDAQQRGAFSLPRPQQEVDLEPDGRPRLRFRSPLPAERWNEQISLLTGRAAATLMLDAKVGLLRTLPTPEAGAVESLRRSAIALGFEWPVGEPYGEVLGRIDPQNPKGAALLDLAPRLLRGAAYTAFDGTVPDHAVHSAVGAPYAHCTAPLRRLADRFVTETCLAICSGNAVPEWVRTALPELPEVMAGADHRAHALDRAANDLAEAIVLQPCVGESFEVTVVDAERRGGVVQLDDPAVRAPCTGKNLPVGGRITARLTLADPASRRVQFTAD